MQPAIAIRELNDLLERLEQLPPDARSPEAVEWRSRLDTVLGAAFGKESQEVSEMKKVRFNVTSRVRNHVQQSINEADAFARAKSTFIGEIKGAIYKLELAAPNSPVVGDYDADLWVHISHLVEQERWSQCPSQVAIYVEDKLRSLAGLDNSVIGVDLMKKCFHQTSGVFPLGETTPEKEGWHQFARGFVLAVSNVVRHRLSNREDARVYAMGVIGSASLLLTELFSTHDFGEGD